MDSTTTRIMETLTTNIGESMSINKLTERIKDAYGTAYYANIYQKLQELKKEGAVTLERIGKSSSVSLNFQNYPTADLLAEIDIEKKRKLLMKKNTLILLLPHLEEAQHNHLTVRSIVAAEPERNLKLNRLELLILLEKTPAYHDETTTLTQEMHQLQNKHNLKIDTLILDKPEFQNFATSNEINPVREILANRIILSGQENFWNTIKEIATKSEVKTLKQPTRPADIAETDIIYNLSRFGYTELGRPEKQGEKICIEYTTILLLLQNDARLQEATSVILAKNNFNSNMLAFLSQKFATSARLIGPLKVIQKIRPKKEIEDTIDLLKAAKTEESPVDESSIKQKLELYNVM